MAFPIGIELDRQYIKLGIVSPGGKNSRTFDFIVEPIASLIDEQIIQKITKTLQNEKLKLKSTLVCLSRDAVTVRNLHLPSQDTKEIAQMIDLHISRLVPYKKEEIIFSHQFLGIDEMSYSRVILAIVQIETLRRQVKILEGAGFLIDQISLSSYGTWQWVMKNYRPEINPKDLYLILDIDYLFTDFIIFSQQGLLFTRSVNIGAVGIRATEEASLTKLIGEIKQSLIIFYNEEINKKPAKIFLTGSTATVNFVKALETEFGIPVRTALVTSKRTIPTDVSLSALAGIILEDKVKGLTFTLPELQIKRSIREKTRELIILGSLSIYIFFVVCVMFLGRIYNQQTYLRRLSQRYSIIDKEVGDLIKQAKKIDLVKDYLYKRQMPFFAIYQLQKIVPDEMTINSMAIDEEQNITLRGQTFQLSDVFKFITALEKTNYFYDVRTKYTRKKKLKDKEINEFELTFRLTK